MMKLINKYKKEIIGGVLGAIGAYFYWKIVGCSSGTCPITSNWYTMIPYGVLLGALLPGVIWTKKKTEEKS